MAVAAFDDRRVHTVSTVHEGGDLVETARQRTGRAVAAEVIGRHGASRILVARLDDDESAELCRSADQLRVARANVTGD